MRRLTKCAALLGALLLYAISVSAQEPGWIALDTNARDAVLYADSIRLGHASVGFFEIPSGAVRLRLVQPEVGSWSASPIETTVEVNGGDTLYLSLNVPYRYRIDSVPFGAAVYLASDSSRGNSLGETPLVLARRRPIEENLVIHREGYHPRAVEAGTELWNRHSTVLQPLLSQTDQPGATEVEWHPPSRRRTAWIDYASVGLGAAAAVVAIHYKFKADRLYDQFLDTGDMSLRKPIERYDRRAGAALIGMQAGLTLFALRLILK